MLRRRQASRKDYDGSGTDLLSPRAGGEPVVSLVHYQRGGSLRIAATDVIMDASGATKSGVQSEALYGCHYDQVRNRNSCGRIRE
jgi:hypothetical protein